MGELFPSNLGKDAPPNLDQWIRRRLRMCLWKQWHAFANCECSAFPCGLASRWQTPGKAHGNCPGTPIMPFRIPIGNRKG
ncbi:group II intron maturase-specific domain-containing protein [Paenibacillus sp. BR2-3]